MKFIIGLVLVCSTWTARSWAQCESFLSFRVGYIQEIDPTHLKINLIGKKDFSSERRRFEKSEKRGSYSYKQFTVVLQRDLCGNVFVSNENVDSLIDITGTYSSMNDYELVVNTDCEEFILVQKPAKIP